MDDDHARDAESLGDRPQRAHAQLGVGRREAAGGFVAEKQGGVRGHPPRQRHPALLTSGNATDLCASDVCVGHAAQRKTLQENIDPTLKALVAPLGLPLERSVELDGLAHCPMCGHHVLLADVRGDPAEQPVPWPPIDQDLSTVLRRLFSGEHVQQGGLSTAARPHYGYQLPSIEVTRARLEDDSRLSASLGGRQREGEVLECQGRLWQSIRRLPDVRRFARRVCQEDVRGDADLLRRRRLVLHGAGSHDLRTGHRERHGPAARAPGRSGRRLSGWA
mmetsp:Transcript_1258/g.2914  ORF Transcript_1258/g.2914 Transcript_1258/m.2914 type:complete len:277 (+) Transcript_1258:1311-2141(+)